MGLMKHFPLNFKHVEFVAPISVNAAVQGGNYEFISLRHYHFIAFFYSIGVHTGDGTAVTIQQAKNVEGNGAKALGFTEYYDVKPTASPPETSDRWNEQTASSNTFDIAAQTVFCIPIRHNHLDVDNDFDCVRPHLAATSAATLIHIYAVLGEGIFGIPGNLDHIPSVKVNRMP